MCYSLKVERGQVFHELISKLRQHVQSSRVAFSADWY
jgi:hypothetical protein